MNTNARVLLEDSEIVAINDIDVYDKVIEYRKKNDTVFISDVSKLAVVAKNPGETAEAFRARTHAALGIEEIEKHCSESMGLFLDFNTEINGMLRHGVIPLRDIAWTSLLERARLNCFTISNLDKGPDYDIMPLQEKLDFINKALRLYGGVAKILYRDRKITSVMSGQYYFIGHEQMNNGLLALKDDFSDMQFEEAVVSHSFFKSTYALNDAELEEDIALAMADAGHPVNDVKIIVSAYTGDQGKIAATFYGQVILDKKKILFGSPESIKHSGKKNDEIIKAAAKKLYSSFKENEEKIKLLPTIEIKHPAGCFRSICKEFHMPKKIACTIADTLETRNNVTAYEIYWLLNEIVAEAERNGADHMKLMQLQEEVAKTLNINYRKFDKEFLWNRGELTDAVAEDVA